jgi:predicted O-linked N-acetylglucosamine transferase (SPINDLY family)
MEDPRGGEKKRQTDQAIRIAQGHHQAARLTEAEKIYRRILTEQPDHADALHLLGVLYSQTKRFDEAVKLIRHTIRLLPRFAEARSNLGIAFYGNGQFADAIAAYKEAIQIKPEFAEAHFNLGIAFKDNRQFDEAIDSYRRAVRLKPDLAEAHNNLGVLFEELGRHDEAIESCQQAIRIKPDFGDAHYNLAIALDKKGLYAEAVVAYRRVIQLKPGYPDAHNNLGNALTNVGGLGEAAAAYEQVIRLEPGFAEAHCNLGNTLRSMERPDQAIDCYRRTIALKPEYAEGHNGLGNALHDVGQIDESIAAYRQAMRLMPERALPHSNLLFALNYHPDMDPETVLAEHRAWAEKHARPLAGEIIAHTNNRSPDRPLRIGYVSGDFRRHSVGYFLTALLEHHDRHNFEVFCYAGVRRPDDMTGRMKRSSDVWRNISGLSDEEVATLIRSDGIDILLDLSGHTSGNRLQVFARKPAPIQVTYLGYANTTGMNAMDYRLTDALADPAGMTDQLNVEKLWRLPVCAWCYEPPEDAPEIDARGDGPITFGCFNSFAKINHKLVAIWAELLKHVPDSHLLLKSTGAGEASARKRLVEQFAECGVPFDRIEMLGRIPEPRGALQLYGRVDVALDTYPYHGTTTTCEALWMGVPVVSLAGRTHVSRVAVSLLTSAGLPELIAQTREEYLSIASELATDRSRLNDLRAGLRNKLKSSPLVDARRFAADVEAAYGGMWRNWCEPI